MTKQDRIEQLEKELAEAYQTIERLKKDADNDFSTSPEYASMRQEMRALELSQGLAELRIENDIKSNKHLMEQIRKIREDNVALCAEHDQKYWEGITGSDRFAGHELRTLERRILDLEAKLEAKDAIIEYYRDILGGKDPQAPRETVMGRKPIPDDQKKRIQALRKKGYKLKEIAGMEGISLGAVSAICKGIKVPSKQVNH